MDSYPAQVYGSSPAACNQFSRGGLELKCHFLRALVLYIFALIPLCGQEWPMYLHDPTHSSFDPNESLLNPGNVGWIAPLWKTFVGGPISTGVTASNGVLFFGAWDGNFYAVDASTGAVLWV